MSQPAVTDAGARSTELGASVSPCSAHSLCGQPKSQLGSCISTKIEAKKTQNEIFSITRSQHKLLKELLCKLHDHTTLLRLKQGRTFEELPRHSQFLTTLHPSQQTPHPAWMAIAKIAEI